MTGPGKGNWGGRGNYNRIPNPDRNYPRSICHAICTRCRIRLPPGDFYSSPRKYNGLYSACKGCTQIAAKDLKYCHPPAAKTLQDRTEEDSWCNKCHKLLPAHKFNSNRERPHGIMYICKDCVPVYERTVVDTRCINCEKTLPASDFCTMTKFKTGINHICKARAKEKQSQWYWKNKKATKVW